MADCKMGIETKLCSQCAKNNIGAQLYNMFVNDHIHANFFLRYDHKTETFLIDEDMLMWAIQVCNPGQPKRNIKVVTRAEFCKRSE